MDIVIEGVFAIQRLIKKYGKALSASEWSHLQSIITYAAHLIPNFQVLRGPGEHRHKEQFRSLQAVENDGGQEVQQPARGAEREREMGQTGNESQNAALASNCAPEALVALQNEVCASVRKL